MHNFRGNYKSDTSLYQASTPLQIPTASSDLPCHIRRYLASAVVKGANVGGLNVHVNYNIFATIRDYYFNFFPLAYYPWAIF